ncbi:hypothetical protein [Rhodococcus marinonascens]|uniref:hypothetical protein n=1 Tax=Rhodococcus marinonascens TaxID=38311 RepID=UPI000934E5C7|nr:hypothetical protein [Rhodococcus marinonascens]
MSTTKYLRRRATASQRLEPFPCGHRDPWICSCSDTKPAPDADVVAAAARHLVSAIGMPGTGYDIGAVRSLWRRGGGDAHLAELINRCGGINV